MNILMGWIFKVCDEILSESKVICSLRLDWKECTILEYLCRICA